MQTTACCCQRREQSSEKWKKEESPCTTRLQSSACSTSPLCLQCIYALLCSASALHSAPLASRALLEVLLCFASLLAAYLCPTLLNLPWELCLQCTTHLCLQYICAPLCTTCHPRLWCVPACTGSILVVITSQPFLQISILHHHQQSFLCGWFSLLLPQCFCIAHIADSILFAHGTSQTLHSTYCMNAHIGSTADCLTWLQTTQMAANAVFAAHS